MAEKGQGIVVASYKAPEPQIHQVGEQGLLDLAINCAMTKSLSNHLKRIDLSWYNELPQCFVDRLKNCQMDPSAYPRKLDTSKSCKTALAQAGGNKLLTLQLVALGARREYFGFIPKGAPTAYCVLRGTLTNPRDEKIGWRYEAEVIQPVQGNWDQPPHYLNFTQALHLAIDEAKQEVLDSFFGGR